METHVKSTITRFNKIHSQTMEEQRSVKEELFHSLTILKINKSSLKLKTMPFTPLHFGPVILVHGIAALIHNQWIREPRNRLSILLLYVGSVIPDLQGLYSVLFDSSVKLHGFSHTLVGALVYSLIVYSTLFLRRFTPLTEYLEFQQIKHFTLFILAIIVFHFLPDIQIWPDMNILWPFGSYSPGEVENYAIVSKVLFFSGLFGSTLLGISFLKSGKIPI